MNRKIKDALTLGIAAAFVLMFALWSICKSDDAVSESERRPLKQFPTLNVEEVLSGRFQSNFESYTLDQFPLRDELRTLKALSVRDLFGEKDNNGIYVADGYAAKLDDTIHEDSLDHAADRFRYVYETYLKDTGVNVYLSVIPDKNYFLAAENGYPVMDYEKFFALMRQKVDFADYIDLTGTLSLSSYYRTDLHWRQEMLAPTAKALADAMGVSLTVDFTEVTLDTPFYGVYRGQSALPMEPDRLAYLTNDIIGSCRVYDYESGAYLPVYTLEKADGSDPYEIFLSGPKSLLRIREPERAGEAKTPCLPRFVRREFASAACGGIQRDHACRHPLPLPLNARKIHRLYRAGRAVSLQHERSERQLDHQMIAKRA